MASTSYASGVVNLMKITMTIIKLTLFKNADGVKDLELKTVNAL